MHKGHDAKRESEVKTNDDRNNCSIFYNSVRVVCSWRLLRLSFLFTRGYRNLF